MRKNYYCLTIFCIILFIGQLLTETHLQIAFLFSIAIFFGLSAVLASGRWNSMIGLLNLTLIVKFLLFGIVIKLIFWQSTDSPLLAPTQTAIVTSLGFAGVLIGTLIYRVLPKPKAQSIFTYSDGKFYLLLYLCLLILGYASWLYVQIKRLGLNDIEAGVGGVFGILGAFGSIKELSISAAVYYVWSSNSKRILSHPLVLFTLTFSILIGIYSTSKQGILQPMFYLFLTVVTIKGFRYKPLWITLIATVLLYTNLIYPYSQYGRYVARSYSSAAERAIATSDFLSKMIYDREYLNSINKHINRYESNKTEEKYLPIASSFSRFAMVSEADKLIAASTNSEKTGWKTISWGFNMILPRFINSDKPIFAANNYLARIVGKIGSRDFTTQVSYGFMANFFNAFGFVGVFFGSALLISSLYYWLSLFFGEQMNLNIWGILIVGEYNHPLTEQSVAGIIASIWFPIITFLVFILAKTITKKVAKYQTYHSSN